MKAYLSLITALISLTTFGQLLDGPLIDEGRKLVVSPGFIVTDAHEGVIIFQLAVDRKGNVTSAKIDPSGTTVVSTPARIVATKHVKTFKFQEGTYFPEFHHVRVMITLRAQ